MHSAICHGDLLRALAKLNPKSHEERRLIALMLGFDWQLSGVSVRNAEYRSDQEEPERGMAPRIEPWKRPEQLRRPAPPPVKHSTQNIRVLPARSVPPPRLEWLERGTALPSGTLGRTHAPRSLFRPQWTRAILSTSLSARRPIGPPDLDRAVELIARGEALSVLPRLPILTLARGVQVLIDVGEGMQPFWHDRAMLRRDLKRIVGDGGLELLQCTGSPHRSRREGDVDWSDYETRFPPKLGACVLLVSDFGLNAARNHGASFYIWFKLARRLARRGHRVVGFVPYPEARWPTDLARAIDLVIWDHHTTVGRISLARRRRAR